MEATIQKFVWIALCVGLLLGSSTSWAQERVGGPYTADSATVLLLHLDGDYTNAASATRNAEAGGQPAFQNGSARPDLEQSVFLDNTGSSVDYCGNAGNDCDFITVADTSTLDITGDWTLETWVRVADFSNGFPRLLHKVGSPVYLANWYMAPRQDGLLRSGYKRDGRGWHNNDLDDGLIREGRWYHVAFVRDTRRDSTAVIVHDEELNLLGLSKQPIQDKPNTTDQPLFIGVNPANTNMRLIGSLDEVRVSNVVRRLSDVPPIINAVTQLGIQSSRAEGYSVATKVAPNIGGQMPDKATLHYDAGEGFQTTPMSLTGDSLFSADIPAQPEGATVSYYVSAHVEGGEYATMPVEAESGGDYLEFEVLDPVQVPDSLVLALDFEGSGAPEDESAFQHIVKTHGDPVVSTEAIRGGQALAFDGEDDFLEIDPSPFLASKTFTLDFWFHADRLAPNTRLIIKEGDETTTGSWSKPNYQVLVKNTNGDLAAGSQISADADPTTGTNTSSELRLNEVVQPYKWYRATYRVHEDSSVFVVRDQDNQIVGRVSYKHEGVPVRTAGPFRIAYAGPGKKYFSGRIDDVKIYNYPTKREIEGLRATATARNATLTWNAYDVPVGKTAGYNIYRRTATSSYGEPIAYTGVQDTAKGQLYTDTRLVPGETYFYQVRARDGAYEEFGESGIEVTTESSTSGYVTYANLKVAVVVFRNTNCRPRLNCSTYQISDRAYQDLRFMLEKARRFYWQNSGMKLNLEFTYYPIDAYVDFGNGGAYSSANQTGEYLRDHFAVTKTQYDIVYMINAGTGGNHSFGTIASDLRLPGPDRGPSGAVAYSHHPVPQGGGFLRNGVYFPDKEEGSDHIWLFTHEGQHAIDAVYKDNGAPQMGHGDFPELYGNLDVRTGTEPGYRDFPTNYPAEYPEGYGERFGKRFDFQGTMLREFDAYESLNPEWGELYEARDADGDAFPDRDRRVPLHEEKFGSSTSASDSDGDGLADTEEAMGGIYHYSYSDPSSSDTDGDDIPDGEDKYPRYQVDTAVKKTANTYTPMIDGDVGEWTAGALVSDGTYKVTGGEQFEPKMYMAYDDDSLYVALQLPDEAAPILRFDFDNNGRWYGAGNMDIEVNTSEALELDSRFERFRSWDATAEVQQYLENSKGRASGNGMWDDTQEYQQQFQRRVIDPDSVRLGVRRDLTSSQIGVELAVPKSRLAGLTLGVEDSIGFYVDYKNVNGMGAEATTFDRWSYVYVQLSGETYAGEESGVLSSRQKGRRPTAVEAFEGTAMNKGVHLTWKAKGLDGAGFEVQRKVRETDRDSLQTWQKVGYVTGTDTTEEATYSYRVRDLGTGKHMFRLKQTGPGGMRSYSSTVEVAVELRDRLVLEPAYPNPFHTKATLKFGVREAAPVKIVLYDPLGRRVKMLYEGTPAANQMQKVTMDPAGLTSGLHFVRMVSEGHARVQAVTLVR